MNPLPPDTVDEVQAVRNGAGLWLRDTHTFVRLTGPDAASWLQSQTTNNVAALETGQGHHNALLDRQGRLQGHFTLHRWEDEYWMLAERAQAPRILQQLDDHLFIEEAQMEETGGELDQVVVQGPQTLPLLASVMDTDGVAGSKLLPTELHGVHPAEVLGYEVLAFKAAPAGEDGYVFVLEKGEGRPLLDALMKAASDYSPLEIAAAAQEILRIEAGIPRYGVDMDETHVIPETTLERDCVDYDKGCYLGQEVVARLKAYGSVKQALSGLVFTESIASPTGLVLDGKSIGTLTSTCYSPTLDSWIALAYLDRDHRAPGQVLPLSVDAEVRVLPMYAAPSRGERAQALYDEALARFQDDLADEDDSAIGILKDAILLNPAFEDAYEGLGVILHRQGRTDEAIRAMKQLVALNADSMMAHTNLSVFYVAKGLIQAAEEEKAKAEMIQMQHASNEDAAKEVAEAERARLEEEARRKIAMFEEVLDIDPDDPVATFGLGKAHVQLGAYEDAIPHLRHATEVQKDFSAAFLDLGKCHEFTGQPADAIATYREGIAVASRKGDLMPMHEMERRLKTLETNAQPTPQ